MPRRSGYPEAEPTGRLWYHGSDAGIAFALAPSIVVTACHIVRDLPGLPSYLPDHGGSIPVSEIEKDEELDVAALRLRGSVPAKLAITMEKLEPGVRWRVNTNPFRNDPELTGEVTAGKRVLRNEKGYEASLIQFVVDEELGDYQGYSGSPVLLADNGAVIGVLVEQVWWRTTAAGSAPPASNVLFAVPIDAIVKRFNLRHAVTVVRRKSAVLCEPVISPIKTLQCAGSVERAAISPDGRSFAVWHSASGEIFDTSARHQAVRFTLGGSWKWRLRTLLHSQLVDLLSFATNSRMLGALTRESAVLLDTRTGKEIQNIPGTAYRAMTFSPNGRHVALAVAPIFHAGAIEYGISSSTDPGEVCIWDIPAHKKALTIYEDGFSLAFDKAGRSIAIGSTDGSSIHSAHTGETIQKLDEAPSEDVALSPDGTVLAVVKHPDVSLWRADTGSRLWTLAHGNARHGPRPREDRDEISFDRDGRRLAVSCGSSITVVDVVSGHRLHADVPFGAKVQGFAFDDDGSVVAATGRGTLISLTRISSPG